MREDGTIYTHPHPFDHSGELYNGKGAANSIVSELRSYWRRQWDEGYPMPDGRVRPEGPADVSIRASKSERVQQQAEKDRLDDLPPTHCRNWARNGWCPFEAHCKYVHAKGAAGEFEDSPAASIESSSEGGNHEKRRRKKKLSLKPCPYLAKGRCAHGDKCVYAT